MSDLAEELRKLAERAAAQPRLPPPTLPAVRKRNLKDILEDAYYSVGRTWDRTVTFAYVQSGKIAALGYGAGAYALYELSRENFENAAWAGGAFLVSRMIRNSAVESNPFKKRYRRKSSDWDC